MTHLKGFPYLVDLNLAAPFFQVVEMFKILGLRDDLFDEVQRQIEQQRQQEASAG